MDNEDVLTEYRHAWEEYNEFIRMAKAAQKVVKEFGTEEACRQFALEWEKAEERAFDKLLPAMQAALPYLRSLN